MDEKELRAIENRRFRLTTIKLFRKVYGKYSVVQTQDITNEIVEYTRVELDNYKNLLNAKFLRQAYGRAKDVKDQINNAIAYDCMIFIEEATDGVTKSMTTSGFTNGEDIKIYKLAMELIPEARELIGDLL